jgi:hypothetical protein
MGFAVILACLTGAAPAFIVEALPNRVWARPRYDTIIRRWKQMTGARAHRDAQFMALYETRGSRNYSTVDRLLA